MERRPLGSSGLEVSVLSLGSWRTLDHVPFEQGLAVMRAAREAGIDFLDDARYDDETGRAPIPTGYSEVVFGELFRTAGWRRDEVTVAQKLWWEFWPGETAEQELDASLGRMGFEHVDLIYATSPPPDLQAEELVDTVGRLLRSGKARAWGVCSWAPSLLAEACRVARHHGVPLPSAAQLPYSVVSRQSVEGADAAASLEASGAGVVASFALGGGALTGKYGDGAASGRHASRRDDEWVRDAIAVGARLQSLAAVHDTSAAALSLAFALAGPRVSSVLFGATAPEQLRENVTALDVAPELVEEVRRLAPERAGSRE